MKKALVLLMLLITVGCTNKKEINKEKRWEKIYETKKDIVYGDKISLDRERHQGWTKFVSKDSEFEMLSYVKASCEERMLTMKAYDVKIGKEVITERKKEWKIRATPDSPTERELEWLCK